MRREDSVRIGHFVRFFVIYGVASACVSDFSSIRRNRYIVAGSTRPREIRSSEQRNGAICACQFQVTLKLLNQILTAAHSLNTADAEPPTARKSVYFFLKWVGVFQQVP